MCMLSEDEVLMAGCFFDPLSARMTANRPVTRLGEGHGTHAGMCGLQNVFDVIFATALGERPHLWIFCFSAGCLLLRTLVDSVAQELGVADNAVQRSTVTQEYLSRKWVQPESQHHA